MAYHRVEKDTLVRANVAITLTLVWGGLAGCALAAAVYDIGRWLTAW